MELEALLSFEYIWEEKKVSAMTSRRRRIIPAVNQYTNPILNNWVTRRVKIFSLR